MKEQGNAQEPFEGRAPPFVQDDVFERQLHKVIMIQPHPALQPAWPGRMGVFH
jgi:hypothetical protein